MKIIGTGSAHPLFTLTNSMLTEFLDTSDEWIVERTGIRQRQVISSEKLEDLATEASQKAIENAGLKPADLDYIICSNVVNEYVTPALSCLVQNALKTSCPCVDINAACSGFIYALEIAEAYIKSGMARNVLIVCAEEPTRMVSWKDRGTCVLFGDGAGAVVVTQGDALKSIKVTSSNKGDVLYYEKMLEPTPYISKPESDVPLVMKGREVFKAAITSSVRDVRSVLKSSGISEEQVKYFLLHQANIRIIEAICECFGKAVDKFPHNVEYYGNTSSASIPILLDELNRGGKLNKGDNLVMSAFGAGFTTGACVLEWSI